MIAHGVYAWVPPPVRPALMALVGRVLSPQGVAFIDYNAMPGGHIRQTLREMMLYATAGIADQAERDRAAHALLVAFGQPREGERASVTALREQARLVSQKNPAVLHHDELGAWFDPQMLSDVAAEAEKAGLVFLNEADPLLWEDGFAPADAPEADTAAIVRIAQLRDYETMKFFRQSLFVRAEAAPARAKPAFAAIADLYVAAPCERRDAEVFAFDGGTIAISDTAFADALGRLVEAWPARLKVADLFPEAEWLETLYELAGLRFVSLHCGPREGVAVPGERPLASPLARAQAAAGDELITTLDLMMAPLRDDGPRLFLSLLDGTQQPRRAGGGVEADGVRPPDRHRRRARFARPDRPAGAVTPSHRCGSGPQHRIGPAVAHERRIGDRRAAFLQHQRPARREVGEIGVVALDPAADHRAAGSAGITTMSNGRPTDRSERIVESNDSSPTFTASSSGES